MRIATYAQGQAADASSPSREFGQAVLAGLAKPQKTLPCRYFYDARGSELFEAITRVPEYYPTRTETVILQGCARELGAEGSRDAVLVEFGSGSSTKTELLLAALPQLAAYVPLDISPTALQDACRRLAKRFRGLRIDPIVADFGTRVALPADLEPCRKLGFFPGSTIGNLSPIEACRLLGMMRQTLSPNGTLIIGVDLKKDRATLVRAYADAAGITAEFNLNILDRINRELEGTFDRDAFRHKALYNARAGRIEMHLRSLRKQRIEVLGRPIHFRAGETIHTENSYKYGIPQFRAIASSAGWLPGRVWTDARDLFSVHELCAGT